MARPGLFSTKSGQVGQLRSKLDQDKNMSGQDKSGLVKVRSDKVRLGQCQIRSCQYKIWPGQVMLDQCQVIRSG